MVNFASLLTTAAILSSFNWVTALPQPGSSKQSGSYSSSSNGMNAPPNTGYGGSSNSNGGYGLSNSGYGSSNSGYGSSNSGYGSSNSGYDSSQQDGYGLTTTTTTTTMNDMPTVVVSSSTMTTESMSTSTPSVMYGSGSMNSGSGSYNDCVAQCMAMYPPSPPPPPTATSTSASNQTYGSSSYGSNGDSGSVGTGATKTVIVAPTQGVLRYIPFALNASVGDTIMFMWGANNHTVTKGSALEPCNATQDALFTSGEHNMGFTFTQVVNSTDPIFFHCGTPGHCPKGMFGIINPSSNLDAPTSVSGMIQSLKAQSPSLNAYAVMTDNATSSSRAGLWGGNIDLTSIPTWAHSLVAENVLYTRNLLAMNPEIFKEDGSIDLSTSQSTPLMYPTDVQADDNAQNAGVSTASSGSPSQPSQPSSTSVAGAASTNGPVTPPASSGASSTGPKALAVLMAGLATVLVL